MTSPSCPDQTPSIWRRPLTLVFFVLLASGCSIQKRTVLPGFHIERMHKASQDAEFNSPSPRKMEGMTSLGCALTPPKSPQRWIREGTVLDVQPPQDMASMPKVFPQRVDVNVGERELQEPQPWAKEAKTQSLFGLVSLLSFCLGAVLLATGTPHPLPFLLAAVAFIMKKIQANKVLDIMKTHGEDGKTRREHRQEQRRESKSIWRAALKTVLLAVAALALILAIDNALVFSVTL